ncbi:Uncharacterised protein [Mycobacteroides abscessus]|nr:Uncharacterised protein [Mycobacteroides abscessus]
MTARMPWETSPSSSTSPRQSSQPSRCDSTRAVSRLARPPRTYDPRSALTVRHSSAGTDVRCCWRYAWRSPSRARYASAETPFAVRPSSGAISAGDRFSTSVYQSTARHRSGRSW